jgi:hypothetical protein
MDRDLLVGPPGVPMKNVAFFLAFCMLMAWIVAMTGVLFVGSSAHLLLLGAILLFAFSFSRDRRSVV